MRQRTRRSTNNVNRLALIFPGLVILMAWPVMRTVYTQDQTPASAANSLVSDWKRYTIKDEEFSVLLPLVPAMTTRNVHLPRMNKDRQERVLGAYEDGVVYAIYSIENQKPKQSLNKLIEEFHNQFVGAQSQNSINLGGFAGKEFKFQSNESKGTTHFYITDKRFYVFQVIGSSLGSVDEGTTKFLSSLRLEKNPEGIRIVDGPGDEPNSPTNPSVDVNQAPMSGKNVTVKAQVITKPEPTYSELARQNETMGTVVLRGVFRSTGVLTDIRAVSDLPFGLTARSIAAARQIRFIPAVKDGHFVSMWIQIEYNFNLY